MYHYTIQLSLLPHPQPQKTSPERISVNYSLHTCAFYINLRKLCTFTLYRIKLEAKQKATNL